MAIVQSCQVQMIKNLEVVGAFSAKPTSPTPTPPVAKKISVSVPGIFGHTKIFRDIIQIYCK
jgi:hypothetical protein